MGRSLRIVIVAIIVVAGCAKGPMVGTWKMEIPENMSSMLKSMGASASGEMVFNSDGTCSATLKQKTGDKETTSTLEGTYKLEDKKLTFVPTKVDGKEPQGEMAKTQELTLSDDLKSFTHPNMMGMKFVKQ